MPLPLTAGSSTIIPGTVASKLPRRREGSIVVTAALEGRAQANSDTREGGSRPGGAAIVGGAVSEVAVTACAAEVSLSGAFGITTYPLLASLTSHRWEKRSSWTRTLR